MEEHKYKEFDNGNVYMWLEQDSSVMLKASDKAYNDPVELNAREAREMANYLLLLADNLEQE